MKPSLRRKKEQLIKGYSFNLYPSIYYTLLILAIFPFATSKITQIKSFQIQNISQKQQYEIEIDKQFIGNQLVIEANFQQTSPKSQKDTQYMLLAAEPNQKLPEFYEALFQQNFQTYEDLNVHLDIEGYSTLRKFQSIHIVSLNSVQIGIWNLGLYNLKTDKEIQFNVDINIFSSSEEELYCPENCNSSINNDNSSPFKRTCNKDQKLSNIKCNCGESYVGQTCYFYSPFSEVDEDVSIKVSPLSWKMKSFNISDYQDTKFSLMVQGIFSKIIMSVVYGTISDLWVPNILYDTYDISSTDNDSDEYPSIQDSLKKMFDLNSLNAVEKKYPNHNKIYDQVITVGFYNQNPLNEMNFIFRLNIVESQNENLSGLNQTSIIVFITISCIILFFSPIACYCIRQRRKKLKREMNELGNNEQNQQQNQNNNQMNGSSGSSRQQQQNNNININNNQNQLLEQISQPIIQFFVGGNQVNAIRNQQIRIGNLEIGIGQLNSNRSNGVPIAQIENMQVQRLSKKVVPITKDTINKFMPKQKYCDVIRLYPSLKDEGGDCTVCLDHFEEDTECRITPCCHLFHADCLESWFQKHSTCPYCRNPCNRKGIIKQLQQGQQNSYIKRIQQPHHKKSQKQIKSDGNIEVEEQEQDQNNKDIFQNPQTFSPGRRATDQINSPSQKKERKQGNSLVDIFNPQLKNEQNNYGYQKKPSIIESVLQAINKPFQSLKREIGSPIKFNSQKEVINSPKIVQGDIQHYKDGFQNNKEQIKQFKEDQKQEPQIPIQKLKVKDIQKENRDLQNQKENSQNFKEGSIKENSQKKKQLPQKFQQEQEKKVNQNLNLKEPDNQYDSFLGLNSGLSRNNNILNNMQLFSPNNLSQHALMENGSGVFTFFSPNLSQMQFQPTNEVLQSLNNSMQKRNSMVFDQNKPNAIQSPMNSFQKFLDQEQLFTNKNQNTQLNTEQSQKHANFNFLERSINNYKDQLDGDSQILFKRNHQTSFDIEKNMFMNEIDLIDNYVDNYVNQNEQIDLDTMTFNQKGQSKNDDSQNIHFADIHVTSKSNKFQLPDRNIFNNQPRFFQESKRRESIEQEVNLQSQKSLKSQKPSIKGENISSKNSEGIQTIKNQDSKIKQVNNQNFQEQESSSNSRIIDLSSTIKDESLKQQKSFDNQQFKNIQIVNNLIVLDDDDDEDKFD